MLPACGQIVEHPRSWPPRADPVSLRAFPWAALPRVTRASVAALRAVRARTGPGSVASRAVLAFGALAGTPVEVIAEASGAASGATLTHHVVSLKLAAPTSAPVEPAWWMVLEVEPALVFAVVARAMKRPPVVASLPQLPSATVVGSFAGVVAASVRRAGVPVVLSDACDTSPLEAASASTTVVSFTALTGEHATHVRAFFPSSLLDGATPRFDTPNLALLGALPLELPVVACRVVVTAREVAELSVGDAWMLDRAWGLGPVVSALRGPVWLCAGSSEVGLPAVLEADGRIVLGHGTEELGWSPMADETEETAAVAQAVGEVPVVVRVEIGAVRMKAKEWSLLAPGDVVGLGTKVGSPVVLRVSGAAIAEGELVDLEGEVGVRIRKRLSGGGK